MTVNIAKYNTPLSFDTVLKSDFNLITHDWSGNKLSLDWSYSIGFDERFLIFACKSNGSAQQKPNTNPGQFVEGLWEYSVCELFIGNKNDASYREFNLAPNGAWWACDFLDYRKAKDTSLSQLGCETIAGKLEHQWYCAIKIPLGDFNIENMTVNVCSIIGHEEQVFIALNKRSDIAPDFHLAELRITPQIILF